MMGKLQRSQTYNVSNVYKDNLCCSCGFCIGICSDEAITYDIDKKGFFKPVINRQLCTNCNRCVQFCPGIQYFVSENNNYKEKYLYGYSNNINLRENSSSGGVATEILCFLIKKNIVDYVVIVKNREKLLEPQIEVTNNLQEIIDGSTSKYCPVRYGEVLKKLNNISGRVAVIGLPCQIQAIKNYFQKNNVSNIKMKYYLSLFCNHLPSFTATDFVLKNFGIAHDDVEKILYRGKGWPGYFQISTKKIDHFLPYRKTVATGFGNYFKSIRCLLCNDPFGQQADISFADAYFLNEDENYLGSTFCVVRNEELIDILGMMVEEDLLTLTEGPEKEKIISMCKPLSVRKERLPLLLRTLIIMRNRIPSNHPQVPSKIPFRTLLGNLIQLAVISLGKYRSLWKLLFRIKNGNKLESEIIEVKHR